MDLNRNHYCILGILLFLLGVQFRYVSSFELTERSSRFVEKKLGIPVAEGPSYSLFGAAPQVSRQVVHPPRWLGFSLMSVGGVLFIYSLSMSRPGG